MTVTLNCDVAPPETARLEVDEYVMRVKRLGLIEAVTHKSESKPAGGGRGVQGSLNELRVTV